MRSIPDILTSGLPVHHPFHRCPIPDHAQKPRIANCTSKYCPQCISLVVFDTTEFLVVGILSDKKPRAVNLRKQYFHQCISLVVFDTTEFLVVGILSDQKPRAVNLRKQYFHQCISLVVFDTSIRIPTGQWSLPCISGRIKASFSLLFSDEEI